MDKKLKKLKYLTNESILMLNVSKSLTNEIV